MSERRIHPGGYKKNRVLESDDADVAYRGELRVTVGICYCCQTHPIAKGNLRLCSWCFSDEWDADTRPDPNKITEEDACELIARVAIMEATPPTPVKRFSHDDYSQEQLQTILDGG